MDSIGLVICLLITENHTTRRKATIVSTKQRAAQRDSEESMVAHLGPHRGGTAAFLSRRSDCSRSRPLGRGSGREASDAIAAAARALAALSIYIYIGEPVG